MKNNHRGVQGRIRSFGFAMKGLAHLLKDEPNSLVHLLAAAGAFSAAWFFDVTPGEWLWIASAVVLVFITETLNTAIENLVDLVQPEFHPLAGKVKDLCAGAVLLAALYALVVAFIVFLPYIF